MLQLKPPDLRFSKSANKPGVTSLMLTNTTDKWVAFRVMTTAPKRFSVRPVTGLMKEHGSASVLVEYTPETPPVPRPNYKFRIKSTVVQDGEVNADNSLKSAPAEAIVVTTIQCIFPDLQAHLGSNPSRTDIPPLMPDSAVVAATSRMQLSESSVNERILLARLGHDYKKALEDNTHLQEENVRLREEMHRIRRSVARSSIVSSPHSSSPLQTRIGPVLMLITFFCGGLIVGFLNFQR